MVSPRKLTNHHLPIRMVVTKKIKACISGDRKRNAKNTPARSVDNAATVGKPRTKLPKDPNGTTTGASRSHPSITQGSRDNGAKWEDSVGQGALTLYA